MKGFYHIWAWRPSWSCDLDHLYKLSFPLPKEAPHKIWLWLDLQYSHIFIYSIRCLLLLTFRSQAAIISEKSTVFTFSYRKRRRFFKVFTIYWHGGHLGHVTWTIYINFRSPFPRRLHIKFGFDWPSGFRGEDV